MKLRAEKDPAGHLHERLVSGDGRVEMGLWPVMYGVRIRAGYVGSMSCEIDWCMGDNKAMLTIFYHLLKNYLQALPDGVAPFAGVPGSSRIKPAWNDQAFIKELAEKLNQPTLTTILPDHEKRQNHYS